MKPLRNAIIRAGLGAFHLTGAHHLLRPLLAGVGVVFMLHHVRPRRDLAFQPNHHLEITPEFLTTTLTHLRKLDVEIVTLDEMHRRLDAGEFGRRFACFTFDDGYRDNRDFALPVMRAFEAPFTVYVASDFAEGKGRLWWVALERVVAATETIDIAFEDETLRLDTGSTGAKQAAFVRLHDKLRALPNDASVTHMMDDLCTRYGVDQDAISRELCLSWDELKPFADDPLVTIGAHTITHGNLARQGGATAMHEMTISRSTIEAALQRPVQHFAYPYGDRSAAGTREFALARAAGFKTAVTTRPGMIFPENAAHLTALPRISLNGNYQDARFLPVLTSGAATAVWNGFRRVDAA
jgi:peptidoglycan/xylan/chitin deacetylase (PgdA/CDA1 family)